MNALVSVSESRIHGRGLFAARHIAKDRLIGRYEGPLTESSGSHVLWVEDERGRWIGIEGSNQLRFVNHSEEPNAEFFGDELWSLRAIRRGEEITHDYGDEWE